MMHYIFYFIFTFIISFFLFSKYYIFAGRFNLIDNKNPNYNFKPTPSGSGIIFCLIFFVGNLYFFYKNNFFGIVYPNKYYIFLLSSLILCLISFKDDQKSIDPILRLLAQIILTYLSITSLDLSLLDFPLKILIFFSVGIWIYILNINNFLDGSDGHLISIILFLLLQTLLINYELKSFYFSFYIALILLPVLLCFLLFNLPPAKIYMGDAGSIFLGFISGYIFLEFASKGYFYISLSLLAYPFTDCSITLMKKVAKGYMPWKGMYDYYFLKPTLKNKINHKNVLFYNFFFNIINFVIIYFMIKFEINSLFILSYVFSLTLILIYKNLESNLGIFKIFK
tara:strand:- start:1902 stop:2918 length:1017 start_codon:yes stop_codon:yes gene_type:complete